MGGVKPASRIEEGKRGTLERVGNERCYERVPWRAQMTRTLQRQE